MKEYVCFIVPVQENLHVLVLVSKFDPDKLQIYYNSTPKKISDIDIDLASFQHIKVNIHKNIPKEIIDTANKISSIVRGIDQDTSSISLDYSDYTEKQIQVIKTTMKIPVNEIWPYSRVAEEAGLPKAQRFVGTTMKIVRQPYIVPCQRVKSLGFIRKKHASSKRNYNKMPI